MSQNNQWADAMDEADSPERRDRGLWARCFAEAGGVESAAKAAYIKERMAVLSPREFDATPPPPQGQREFDRDNTWEPWPVPATSGPTRQVVKSAKSRGVYIILGLFFGMFGIHNFYAGRLGVGLAQLLMTCILGWFVVGLVVTFFWVIYDLFAVTKDGEGDAFA